MTSSPDKTGMNKTGPLKIGIVCHATLGGSGIVATELGIALACRGHDVHFIASQKPWRLAEGRCAGETAKVSFHAVPQFVAPAETYTVALAATIAQLAPELDVLHVHYAVPNAIAAYLAIEHLRRRGAPVPVVVNTLHGTDVNPAFAAPLSLALAACDGITTPSHALDRQARRELQLERELQVIANFVDTERFAPPLTAPTHTPQTLLHASNFRAVKRVQDVIAVFAKVRAVMPCELLLVGDGDARREAEALAAPFGDDIKFMGKRHDLHTLLQGASVFLQTSEREGFGLAALEAQSAGVPVVATAVGGVPEVIRDGMSGFLAPVGDIDALAAATLKLLRDRELNDFMRREARLNAVARFGRDQQVACYEDYFAALKASPSSR